MRQHCEKSMTAKISYHFIYDTFCCEESHLLNLNFHLYHDLIDHPCHNGCMENKKYQSKIGNCDESLEILKKLEDGFVVRLYGHSSNSQAKTDYVSKAMFDSCVRAGLLIPIAHSKE